MILLDVILYVTRSDIGGMKFPVNVKALVDTGATKCYIKRSLARKLNLKVEHIENVSSAWESAESAVYDMDIRLPNDVTVTDVPVLEFKNGTDFDFIIGMGILRMGDMAFTNANGNAVFSFRIPPADKHIDFTKG